MTMVERVAEAIAAIEFKMPGAGGLRGSLHMAPAQARDVARAAIEAMLEPTEEVLAVMSANGPMYDDTLSDCLGDMWEAAITAALGEK